MSSPTSAIAPTFSFTSSHARIKIPHTPGAELLHLDGSRNGTFRASLFDANGNNKKTIRFWLNPTLYDTTSLEAGIKKGKTGSVSVFRFATIPRRNYDVLAKSRSERYNTGGAENSNFANMVRKRASGAEKEEGLTYETMSSDSSYFTADEETCIGRAMKPDESQDSSGDSFGDSTATQGGLRSEEGNSHEPLCQ